MKNPQAFEQAWSSAPLPQGQSEAQAQQTGLAPEAAAPNKDALNSFLQPPGDEFNPEEPQVMNAPQAPIGSQMDGQKRFADAMKRRRLMADRSQTKQRGELTYG
jgi:hypothetical protein